MRLQIKHPDEGMLMGYLDAQLTPGEHQAVQAHVELCNNCRGRPERLKTSASRMSSTLSVLVPGPSDQPGRQRALAELQAGMEGRRTETVPEKIRTSKHYQRVLAGVTAAVILIGLFSLAPVRALASDFLGLFRVERFAVVDIDPQRAEQIGQMLEENMYFGEREVLEETLEPEEVASLDEAARLAGFLPSRPQGFGQPDTILIMSGTHVRYTPDVEAMRAVFEEMGLDPGLLPVGLEGQPFDIIIPAGIMQVYDDGDPDTHLDFAIMQMPSPTVEIPEGVDMQKLGEAMLQLLGMSPEEAARMSASIDWTTTLVLPIPTGIAAVSEVDVNGTGGLLFEAGDQEWPEAEGESAVLWQKHGLVNLVVGNNQRMRLIQIAESMEDN